MTKPAWTLVALARSGKVELELDRSVSDPSQYALSITLPSVQLRLLVADIGIAARLSRFFVENHNRNHFAQLPIGSLNTCPVHLIKDDEFADRFYLRCASEGMLEVSLVDTVTNDFVRASEQLEVAARGE